VHVTTELTEIIEASHWIYLPTQGATDAAQRELEFLGFLVETEDAEPDDDHRWLVRAFNLISGERRTPGRDRSGRIAEAHGGHTMAANSAGAPEGSFSSAALWFGPSVVLRRPSRNSGRWTPRSKS